MASLFPPSAARPGKGHVVVGPGPDARAASSVLEAVAYQYPLKLIAPSAEARSHSSSVLVFLLSYGGGLVAGDRVHLAVDVRPGARLSIVTQGTTKVFKAAPAAGGGGGSGSSGGSGGKLEATRQTLLMRVGPGAGLCLLPDPVQPFADSVYEQLQVVRMEDGEVGGEGEGEGEGEGDGNGSRAASLCLLDWVTQGRAARGENWSLTSWKGRNEVWLAGKDADDDDDDDDDDDVAARVAVDPDTDRLLVRDAVLLERGCSPHATTGTTATALADTMHGLAVFGTLILRGPLVHALGRFFLAEFAALPRLGARGFDKQSQRMDRPAEDKTQDAAATAAWRADRRTLEQTHGVLWSAAAVRGCVVVKFGARTVEGGRLWIGSMLQHEGSIAAAFGDDALLCVK